MVTYVDEEDDDWKRLLRAINWHHSESWNRSFFRKLKSLMGKIGEVEDLAVESHVTTYAIEDMVEALSFVASNGNVEKKKLFLNESARLKNVLGRYTGPYGYSFPFRHHFLLGEKAK